VGPGLDQVPYRAPACGGLCQRALFSPAYRANAKRRAGLIVTDVHQPAAPLVTMISGQRAAPAAVRCWKPRCVSCVPM